MVDIVGVLLFAPIGDGIALHGQQCGNGRDGDLDAAAPAVGHVAIDGDELIEPQGEVGSVGALHGEIGDDRRGVPCDGGVARHQEVHDDIDVCSPVASRHSAHKLKAAQSLPLVVSLFQKRLDKLSVLAIPQGFRIQAQVHVQGSDVWHIGFAQQEPGNSATDHGKLAAVAPEELADLDQYRSGSDRRAVGVFGGELRLYFSHWKNSPAKCSAASRSRSLPFQRSR